MSSDLVSMTLLLLPVLASLALIGLISRIGKTGGR